MVRGLKWFTGIHWLCRIYLYYNHVLAMTSRPTVFCFRSLPALVGRNLPPTYITSHPLLYGHRTSHCFLLSPIQTWPLLFFWFLLVHVVFSFFPWFPLGMLISFLDYRPIRKCYKNMIWVNSINQSLKSERLLKVEQISLLWTTPDILGQYTKPYDSSQP